MRSEHGGGGTWQIVEGTGRYENLRGGGSYKSVILSGSPDDFASITYRSTWTGVVAFDATAPVVNVTAKATTLRKPRTYTLRVNLELLKEDPGTRISYVVEVTAGRSNLAIKLGATSTGRATVTARIKPPAAARSIRLSVLATDPVGNASTTKLSFPLPKPR